MKPDVIKIAIQRTDGGLSVMMFVTRDYASGRITEPEDKNIVEEITRAGIEYDFYSIITDVPEDRTFREAWKLQGGAIIHDLPKCKEIYIEKARRLRAAEFATLDREFIIAQQKKEDTTAIEEKAQYLRDLPAILATELESCTTVDEIKSVEIKLEPLGK